MSTRSKKNDREEDNVEEDKLEVVLKKLRKNNKNTDLAIQAIAQGNLPFINDPDMDEDKILKIKQKIEQSGCSFELRNKCFVGKGKDLLEVIFLVSDAYTDEKLLDMDNSQFFDEILKHRKFLNNAVKSNVSSLLECKKFIFEKKIPMDLCDYAQVYKFVMDLKADLNARFPRELWEITMKEKGEEDTSHFMDCIYKQYKSFKMMNMHADFKSKFTKDWE